MRQYIEDPFCLTFEELQLADPVLAKFLDYEVEGTTPEANCRQNFDRAQVLRLRAMKCLQCQCPKRQSAVKMMLRSAANRHKCIW